MNLKDLIRNWLIRESKVDLEAIKDILLTYSERRRESELERLDDLFESDEKRESFYLELSSSGKGFLDDYIEERFDLVRISQPAESGPKPESTPELPDSGAVPEPSHEPSLPKLRFSKTNVLYARKSEPFNEQMVAEAAHALTSKGFDKIELTRPAHLSKEEGDKFVKSLTDKLVSLGMDKASITRAPEVSEPNVQSAKRGLQIAPRSIKGISIPEAELRKKKNRVLKKVVNAIDGNESMPIHDLVASLARSGVMLNYIDSGNDRKGFTYYDVVNEKRISGSKLKYDGYEGANLLGYGGELFKGRLDYNFELEDFFAATIKVAADRVRDKGLTVSPETVNAELDRMGSSFTLSDDLSRIEGYKFVDGDIILTSSRAKTMILEEFSKVKEPTPSISSWKNVHDEQASESSSDPSPVTPHVEQTSDVPPVESYGDMPPISAYGDVPDYDMPFDDGYEAQGPDVHNGFLESVMAASKVEPEMPVNSEPTDLGEKAPSKAELRPRLAPSIY